MRLVAFQDAISLKNEGNITDWSHPNEAQGNGTGDWAEAYQLARALVAQMTNEEKQNITTGGGVTTNGCAGFSPGVPRLGYSGMCYDDGPSGTRATEMVNGYPAGIHAGASWNKTLAYERGKAMGAEAKLKGINVLLAPSIGALGRTATAGRNWEGFSNDPYLCGAMGAQTVTGLQENVLSVAKHFIANEQETNRIPSSYGLGNESVSSNLDDKTMHELYLWPFQDLVKAGVGSIMCEHSSSDHSNLYTAFAKCLIYRLLPACEQLTCLPE